MVVAADGEGLGRSPGRDAPRPGTRPRVSPPAGRRPHVRRPGRRRAAARWRHGPCGPAGDRRRGRPDRSSPGPSPAAPSPPRRPSVLRRPQARRLRRPPPSRRRPIRGMVKRAIGGVERDYLLVAYKGGDKLYVPSDQIDAVRQYIGGETPTLHRLGGPTSPRQRAASVGGPQIAQELVVLYQKRVNEGSLSARTRRGRARWRKHSRSSRRPTSGAIATSRPTWSGRADGPPMCGDVGFGKTEVAVRAAFKAVQDGKQVAVLVPTTLLAPSTAKRSPNASPATRSASRC